MAGSNGSEDRLRRRFRIASFTVILGLLILTVTADVIGRLFIDKSFHSDGSIVIALIGAVVGYAGIEVLLQAPRSKRDDNDSTS